MLYTVLTLQKRTVLWFTDRACLQTAASLHMIGKYAISMLAVEFMDCLSLVCLFARFLWIVVKCWKKKCKGKKFWLKKLFWSFLCLPPCHSLCKKKNSHFRSCHVIPGSDVLFFFLYVISSSAWRRSKETLLASAHRIFYYDSMMLVIILHLIWGLVKSKAYCRIFESPHNAFSF